VLGSDRPPAALRLLVGTLVAALLGGGSSTALGVIAHTQSHVLEMSIDQAIAIAVVGVSVFGILVGYLIRGWPSTRAVHAGVLIGIVLIGVDVAISLTAGATVIDVLLLRRTDLYPLPLMCGYAFVVVSLIAFVMNVRKPS